MNRNATLSNIKGFEYKWKQMKRHLLVLLQMHPILCIQLNNKEVKLSAQLSPC